MDPRNTSSHQPFARPLSPPGVRNARLAPIPPPPYTLQAPLHASQPTPNRDPFLPRRNEHEEVRQEQHKSLSQSPFSLGNYTAGLQREASGAAMENRDSVQENGGSWRFGDGRMGRYRSQSGDGKQLTLQYRQSLLIFLLFPHTESSVSLQSLAPSDHFSTQHKSIACIALLGKIHCTIQNMRIRINAVLKAQTFHTEDMFYGRTIRKGDQLHCQTCSTLHNLHSLSTCVRCYLTVFDGFSCPPSLQASYTCYFMFLQQSYIAFPYFLLHQSRLFWFLHSSANRDPTQRNSPCKWRIKV